jgi:hypothetical protein
VIYCVVPEALADELFDKLTDYYANDPNVTVIIERRKGSRREPDSSGEGSEVRFVRDRRRPRIVGELPATPPGE